MTDNRVPKSVSELFLPMKKLSRYLRALVACVLSGLMALQCFAGSLVNVSVLNGIAENDYLTVGFSIKSRARLLIRGVGPGLIPLGVAGALIDPRIEIFSGGVLIWTNDDWRIQNVTPGVVRLTPEDIERAQVSVGAFPLHDDDAATVITLEAGSYTVKVMERFGRKGNALVEVYELSESK